MNAKILFSDAPYWNKRSLKISNHLVVICVFYWPEGDQFFYRFYGTKSQNRGYFHNAMRLRLESVHVHVG